MYVCTYAVAVAVDSTCFIVSQSLSPNVLTEMVTNDV